MWPRFSGPIAKLEVTSYDCGMRKILILLFFFLIFTPLARAYERPAGCEDAYEKISIADPVGYITYAYFVYCTVEQPDMEFLKIRLQNLALQYDANLNRRILKNIQRSEVNLPEFLEKFSEAIDWSEKEKQKSGKELYELSKTPPESIIRYEQQDDYRAAYLSAAVQKYYAPAMEDLKELDQKFELMKKSIQKKQGK